MTLVLDVEEMIASFVWPELDSPLSKLFAFVFMIGVAIFFGYRWWRDEFQKRLIFLQQQLSDEVRKRVAVEIERDRIMFDLTEMSILTGKVPHSVRSRQRPKTSTAAARTAKRQSRAEKIRNLANGTDNVHEKRLAEQLASELERPKSRRKKAS